ncbi:MAG: 50S ribosomal protein L11 methyltransferase [Ruminococcaceae bacterium]|nr:50S ribosomal protein L11 methyltransferase [Oscillospiraceae bacterium]
MSVDTMDKDYTCQDYGTQNEWTRIKVTVPLEQLDELVAVMSMINNYLQIEDYSDIDLKTCYGDLIDESILNADKTIASVSVYVPADVGIADRIAFIKERTATLGIDGKIEISGVNEDDWANSWKAYYKPIKIGEKIVIVPAWEKYSPSEGEIIVRMDPGMAFGTGSHETTRLVIGLLEKYVRGGERVLDVGTGSGILAICASKLGAELCRAYDIDPVAVRVARENIKDSGEKNITCDQSDLLRGVDLSDGGYDVICANIVADIIIRMTPDVGRYLNDGGVILASGIITERSEDVVECFEANGFEIKERVVDNGWCALVVGKK